MDYDRFVGLVQNRARLATGGDAVSAIRATLTTLAERVDSGEADDLAAQLPREIGYYLRAQRPLGGERFSFGEFCERVAVRENCDLPEAVYHARCVMEVVSEAVAPGEIRDVRGQLPEGFQPLFSGSHGRMRPRQAAERDERWSSEDAERGRGPVQAAPPQERGRWTDDERAHRRAAMRSEHRTGEGSSWNEARRAEEARWAMEARQSQSRLEPSEYREREDVGQGERGRARPEPTREGAPGT